MLGASLLAFWAYPLMPPRLMPARFGFVDTAADFFNFGPQVRVHLGPDGQPSAAAVRTYGNLFAAMPSLHVGWSTWSALAVWPLLRRTWAKVLWALYPVSIFFCIVVTANHWILDAVGGWVVLAVGYLGARGIEWTLNRRRAARRSGHVICATAYSGNGGNCGSPLTAFTTGGCSSCCWLFNANQMMCNVKSAIQSTCWSRMYATVRSCSCASAAAGFTTPSRFTTLTRPSA